MMTAAERKRAHRLMRASEIYGGNVRNKLLLTLFTILVVIITAVSVIGCYGDGEFYDMPGIIGLTTGLTYLAAMFADIYTGDMSISSNVRGSLNGCTTTGKFYCTLPFKAGDLINTRIIRWEQCTVVNIIIVTAVQIIAMIAEGAGYTVYHSYAGLGMAISVFFSAVIMIALTARGFAVLSYGMLVGFCYGMAMDVMVELSEDIAAAARLDETLPAFGAFYGVSGILLYIAAMVLIDIIVQFAVKKRRDVSWRLK